MMTLLLIIIFVSFIGVGLPDSMLGTAWPVIYREFELPISMAGYIASTTSTFTMISSLMSAKLINKFGTGLVTAVCTLLTAIALLGYSLAPSPWFFFLLAIPLGLGAGSVDTALNAFVALHYTASQMSYLHCFYGLGVAVSPFIMSFTLGEDNNWRKGYMIVALIQFGITLTAFSALPLWKKIQQKDSEEASAPMRALTLPQLIKTPGVVYSGMAFFASCALELTAGSWSASFFVNTKGLSSDKAALIAMLFYVGMAGGRFLSGVFAGRLGRRRILRIALYLLPAAIIAYMLPVHYIFGAVALLIIGIAIGPIYPNLVHLTPDMFGEDIAQSVMGIQQTFTYFGILVMPWLFGVMAQVFSTALLPYYLLGLCVMYGITFVLLMNKVKKSRRNSNG